MTRIKTVRENHGFGLPFKGLIYWLLAISCLSFLACGRPPGFGLGGRYLDGKDELTKPRGGDINKAISLLETVALEDPLYKDSLTLLGRAYYKKARYRDTFQILKRALAANPKDEIAWITLGLTQLQLGDNENGLESLKGGLTLLSHASKDGYRGIKSWDKKGLVRSALRKAVFLAMKGLEEKLNIIRTGEQLLSMIDREEGVGKIEQEEEARVGY